LSERIDVEVFFDFACPYVHSAAVWLDEVQRQLGNDAPRVTWRFFPLEQVNAPDDAELAIWDLPLERRSRGRDSMQAAAAARKQGDDAFSRFHSALLALKHERGEDHGLRQTIQTAAVTAGLDLARFNDDLENQELLAEIRIDYTAGREDHGVFGTPTFVFGEGQSAYIKLLPAPPPEDAVAVWDDFVRAVRDRPYLQEIKRPRRQQ
jgi:predicted DsbA family dithiol-disulfide isomerase